MQDFTQFEHHQAMIRKRNQRIAQDYRRIAVTILFDQEIGQRQTRRHAVGIMKYGVCQF